MSSENGYFPRYPENVTFYNRPLTNGFLTPFCHPIAPENRSFGATSPQSGQPMATTPAESSGRPFFWPYKPDLPALAGEPASASARL